MSIPRYSREDMADQAVRDYEQWAQEVPRLTREIGACECPNAAVDVLGVAWVGSCFERAKNDAANWRQSIYPDEPSMPPTLAMLRRAVAACPECLRLCDLIAARKHARQRFGVAKRAVRHAGKRALSEAANRAPTHRELVAPKALPDGDLSVYVGGKHIGTWRSDGFNLLASPVAPRVPSEQERVRKVMEDAKQRVAKQIHDATEGEGL